MSKLKTIILLLFLSSELFANGVDISKEYLLSKAQIQTNSFDNQLLLGFLKSKIVVFIPGITSTPLPSVTKNSIKTNYTFGEIFGEHEDWMLKNGLKYEYLEMLPNTSSEENIQFISEVLKDLPNDIIIFTHSKSGLDTFSALIKTPELQRKISGIITIQTPFKGIPSINTPTVKWSLSLLAVPSNERLELASSVSHSRNIKFKKDYQDIIESIPVINYGSYKKDSFGWDSPLESSRDYIQKEYGRNDGLTPLRNSFLDNSYHIIEEGVDHLSSVTRVVGEQGVSIFPKLKYKKSWQFDRQAHFKALLESLRKASY